MVYVGAYGFEVCRADLFHLNLNLSVARVYIVKLLLARGTYVALVLSVEVFVDMYKLACTTDVEA